MIVVSDSSALIGLASVGHLDLLRMIYGEVLIPPAVYREVVDLGEQRPGVREVTTAAWIKTTALTDRTLAASLTERFGPGESEAIALAVERDADVILLDEHRARGHAARLGLRVIGVVGVLLRAKRGGQIERVKPILDMLIFRAGFRISARLYEQALRAVGEAD